MRAPSQTLALLVVLVGATLGSLPLSSAQGSDGMLPDERGDVNIQLGGMGQIDGTDIHSYPDFVDILSVGIAEETQDAVVAKVRLAGYTDPPSGLLTSYPLSYFWAGTSFTINEAAWYGVSTWMSFAGDLLPQEPQAWVWRYQPWNGDYVQEQLPPEAFTIDLEGGEVSATIGKDLLLVGKTQRGLRSGDELNYVNGWAGYTASLPLFQLEAQDWAWGEVSMAFQHNAPNAVLSLGFIDPDAEAAQAPADEGEGDHDGPSTAIARGPVALAAGQTKALPLQVANGAAQKKIANLTAAMVGEDGKPLSGWKAQVAPSVIVDARSSVNVNVIVTAPPGAGHREGGVLRVTGHLLGEPDLRGRAERDAYVALGLTPERNQVHIHSYVAPFQIPYIENAQPLLGNAYRFHETAGSVLDEDPLYADPEVDLVFGFFEGAMDTVDPAEVELDADGEVLMTLRLAADRERRLFANLDLYAETTAGGDVDIGRVQNVELAVGTSAADHVVSVPVDGSGKVLPEGSRISWRLWFSEDPTPMVPGGLFNFGTVLPHGVKWDVSSSHLAFPVTASRMPTFRATSGEFLPTVALAKGESREDFSNPGKTAVFNLTLVNGGTFNDVVDLTVNGTKRGWTTTFKPGKSYKLAPGQAVSVGLEVRAPAAAVEGELFEPLVVATSRNDPVAASEVRVRVIVTQAIELPDQNFRASSESANLTLERQGKESPGAAMLPTALLVVAAACGVARWRRKA